jgi:diguanylate cyclase (GGDEF)-like protein
LLRGVAVPTALTLLVLAAIIGAVLHFSTSKSDEIALARQNQRGKVAIEQSLKAVRIDQEASTYWDDAVVRTREVPLDLEWIDDNLGVWFNTYYHIDEVYLLDRRDAPIYAMADGRRTAPKSFARVADPALALARELRARLAVNRLAPDGSAERTIGVSVMTTVVGRPAFVSLKPILSETGKIAQPRGSEYIHVAVRYLDGTFLAGLSKNYSMEEPRFGATPVSRAGSPIRGPDGRILGYISWKPFRPGKQVEDRMLPVLSAALLIVGALLALLLLRIFRSRMELEASRAQAQHLAFHDALTGLPNRALFEDRLRTALARRDPQAAVLMLDLDRFKNVNDTLGHQAGDMLIRQFGKRLCAMTREGDTVSRLGGDEFAILIDNARISDVQRLAKRILIDIRRSFELLGAEAHVGVSIGIAIAPEAGTDRLELVRKADIALYRAKDGGRNAYCLFSPEMDDYVKQRGRTEEELREAVSSASGLCIRYQPQVGVDGKVLGLEALLRWEHPTRGLIAPDQFISVAEETGLIVPLGGWVFRQACLASRSWPGLFVAVNLSPVQFRSAEFFPTLMRTLRATGADPRSIQLEVTERLLLDDGEDVQETIAKLRAAGFTIVLDDFGTGYSSLSYLRKFVVDKIKIDGSFVRHLEDSPDSRAIVAAVLAMGEAIGVTVTAEGVETADQKKFLELAGCKEMQGHYFAAAMPADDVAPLLTSPALPAAA